MANGDTNSKANFHRLQGCVAVLMPILGGISAFVLTCLTLISVYLVNISAYAIHETAGVISLVITLLIGAGVVYLLVSMRKSPIIISSRFEGKRRLDVFTPIYLILVLCAFVQTSFWVIDPDNNIHEPRSVFIIAVAAAFAYLRRQNQSRSTVP